MGLQMSENNYHILRMNICNSLNTTLVQPFKAGAQSYTPEILSVKILTT